MQFVHVGSHLTHPELLYFAADCQWKRVDKTDVERHFEVDYLHDNSQTRSFGYIVGLEQKRFFVKVSQLMPDMLTYGTAIMPLV